LGKLRSSGKNRSLNRVLNYWASTVFVQMLTRRDRLAGIEVLEVWGGYSSAIGNLAFDPPTLARRPQRLPDAASPVWQE
jgi:hypothetical protein